MQTLLVDQLVGHTVGGYRVERLLGQGRLTAVYLAQHPVQQSMVALTTFIVPERFSREAYTRFMIRFTREAQALTVLNHKQLLPVYAYGEEYGYPYLVTPYMMHGSLADQLKQGGRFTPAYVLEVVEQVALGLDYAHSKGIIHGTLKPSNILLNQEGKMLVAGFGLTHMLQLQGVEQSNHSFAHLLSIADTFLGPPEYMAPEIVQGRSIDIRSDIYALGCIVFELLHGEPPFTGTSALEIALQHVQQPLPSLHALQPDIPIALELVINHALARDPVQRFQHASEFVETFAHVCKGINSMPSSATGKRPLVKPFLDTSKRAAVHHDISLDALTDNNIPDDSTSWQLMPPIVTNKSQALSPNQQSGMNAQVPMTPKPTAMNATGPWQLVPPIITGKLEAVSPPTPLVRFTDGALPAAPRTTAQQRPNEPRYPATMAPSAPVQPASSFQPVQPGQPGGQQGQRGSDASSTWWAHVDPAAKSDSLRLPAVGPAFARQAAPQPARPPQPMPVQAAQPLVNIKAEVTKTRPSKVKRAKVAPTPNGRARNVGRRRVLALLATGGVVAAGAAVAVNLHLLHLPTTSAPIAAGTTKTAPTQKTGSTGGQKPQPGKGNTAPANKPQGHTGTVVGATTMAANTAKGFSNPADGKQSLLVHLPNNAFAAYESACTHEGVPVNYDPVTHMFICPAHGAIFDPAKAAMVVQGPATRPLAAVTIHVNADGTITAA